MSNKRKYLAVVIRRLKARYRKEMKTSLDHESEWELLVATMLSAQSQDKQVNRITGNLFGKYGSVDKFANAKPKDLYPYIGSLGLYRNKSKNIIATAKKIMRDFGGRVPNTIEKLTSLPGVGRKTANVVLANAFGTNEGIAIDTHCITVANRLHLTKFKDAKRIEIDLMRTCDRKDWGNLTHLFISLGRDTCTARSKHCNRCVLKDICPSSTV